MKFRTVLFCIAVVVTATGCPRPPAGTPGAGAINLSGTNVRPPNRVVDGPLPGCADALELVGQALSLPSGSLTLDAGGIIDRVSLITTGATYTFSTRPVNPVDCSPTALPATPPVTVTFGFNHVGDFTRVDPVCMNTSTIAMTGFSITGTPIDALIEPVATGIIWLEVDRQVATRINTFVNGSSFPATADPRCSNWEEATMPTPPGG